MRLAAQVEVITAALLAQHLLAVVALLVLLGLLQHRTQEPMVRPILVAVVVAHPQAVPY